MGFEAGKSISQGVKNTIIGGLCGDALTTGDNNIIIGHNAAASAVGVDNTTVIGTTTTTSALVHGLKQPVIAASANVAAAAAFPNSIFNFSDADGAIVTLPDSGDGSQIGKSYEFITTATATSNIHQILLSDDSNELFIGNLTKVTTGGTDVISDISLASDTYREINMNGTTQGGIKGSYVKCTNIAVDLWHVQGTLICSGTIASAFN